MHEAFKGFKFKAGDVVCHKADASGGLRMVVAAAFLWDSGERCYRCSAIAMNERELMLPRDRFDFNESELRLAQPEEQ